MGGFPSTWYAIRGNVDGSLVSGRVPSTVRLLRVPHACTTGTDWDISFASPIWEASAGRGTSPRMTRNEDLHREVSIPVYTLFLVPTLLLHSLGLLPRTQNCCSHQESASSNSGPLARSASPLAMTFIELFRRHWAKESCSPCQGISAQQQTPSSVISARVSLIYCWGNIKADEYWKKLKPMPKSLCLTCTPEVRFILTFRPSSPLTFTHVLWAGGGGKLLFPCVCSIATFTFHVFFKLFYLFLLFFSYHVLSKVTWHTSFHMFPCSGSFSCDLPKEKNGILFYIPLCRHRLWLLMIKCLSPQLFFCSSSQMCIASLGNELGWQYPIQLSLFMTFHQLSWPALN